MDKLQDGVAFGALGLAVVETLKIYCDTAPALKDIRCAPVGDSATSQLILDADMMGLIVVLAIGGGGLVLVRKWYPLLLAGSALLLVSAYYRSVARSSNVAMVAAYTEES